jgi:hypothetical protein
MKIYFYFSEEVHVYSTCPVGEATMFLSLAWSRALNYYKENST